MDRDMLFRHLEQRYTSKRDMISRVPLGVQPDALWQELLNQRRSRSTVLPLYNYKGLPYWYVTTDKMVAASEKIIEALFENETEYDPYLSPPQVSTLEEAMPMPQHEKTSIHNHFNAPVAQLVEHADKVGPQVI